MVRIIFAIGNGITRAPMAAAIFNKMYAGIDVECLCRGVVVAFPEPLNQKTEAVLIGNGIKWNDFTSTQLSAEDYEYDTYVFTMEERERKRIKGMIDEANDENTFVLSDYIGDELEIMDPYGGPVQTYGLCFEVIKTSIKKLIDKLNEEGIIHGEAKDGVWNAEGAGSGIE